MKFQKPYSILVLLMLLLAGGLMACGEKKTVTSSENTSVAHHESTASNTVVLTEEQISTAGITWAPLERKDLGVTKKLVGKLEVPAQNKASVSSLYSGILQTLSIHPGGYVRKGQVLGTLVNTEISGVQQQLISVNAQTQLAQMEVNRQTELVQGNAAPLKNLQRAQSELSSLKAQQAALRKQLATLGISPSRVSTGSISTTLNIMAPITGSVSEIKAQIGAAVDPATPIATIVNNSSLHLDLFVFEKDLPYIRRGQTIHFTLTNAPGREYDARIFSIGTAFANDTRSVPVHAEVEGDKTGLIDGMSVTAIVSLGTQLAPAVPTEAIVSAEGKDYIFARVSKKPTTPARGDNSGIAFERIQVARGTSDLGFTVIQPVITLAAGTEVVTHGAFFLMAKMNNTREHEH